MKRIRVNTTQITNRTTAEINPEILRRIPIKPKLRRGVRKYLHTRKGIPIVIDGKPSSMKDVESG